MKGLAFLFCIAALTAALAVPAASADTLRRCGNVTHLFPGGAGASGAYKVKGYNTSCKTARTTVKTCLKQDVPSGWKVKHTRGFTLVTLTRDDQKITWIPVGGAGCELEG